MKNFSHHEARDEKATNFPQATTLLCLRSRMENTEENHIV